MCRAEEGSMLVTFAVSSATFGVFFLRKPVSTIRIHIFSIAPGRNVAPISASFVMGAVFRESIVLVPA